jgi:maleylpyruvate isomerase
MVRTFRDARQWMQLGTSMFTEAVASLSDADLDESSGLPEWTRRTLVSHVAANADAIGNLVHWAATGDETPMYATPDERAAGIERGSRLPARELRAWLLSSAERLNHAMDALDEARWAHSVVTAQGRTVPATELPWMRSREVMVHTVDLAAGTGFADLPAEFLVALQLDIVTKRGEVAQATGSLADVTAWLAGRRYVDVVSPTGAPLAPLEPWL